MQIIAKPSFPGLTLALQGATWVAGCFPVSFGGAGVGSSGSHVAHRCSFGKMEAGAGMS